MVPPKMLVDEATTISAGDVIKESRRWEVTGLVSTQRGNG